MPAPGPPLLAGCAAPRPDDDDDDATQVVDINPAQESGSDNPGVTGSARSFDVDFDGELDVIVGWNYVSNGSPPSHTALLRGLGNVTFDSPVVLRDFPPSNFGGSNDAMGSERPDRGRSYRRSNRLPQLPDATFYEVSLRAVLSRLSSCVEHVAICTIPPWVSVLRPTSHPPRTPSSSESRRSSVCRFSTYTPP